MPLAPPRVPQASLVQLKQKTRVLLHDKRPQPAQDPQPTAAFASDTLNHSFPVHQLTPPPPPSPAEAAIARLREYAAEREQLSTAQSHCDRQRQLHALQSWWLHHTAHRAHHRLALQLQRSHRSRRQHSALSQWRRYTRSRKASVVQHSQLQPLHARHLKRRCFSAWISFTLAAKQRQASLTLAHLMHRSTALRRTFSVWTEATRVSLLQSALQQQAEQFASRRVLAAAWSVWLEASALRRREVEKERRAAVAGDAARRRYYLRQWRKLRRRLAEDEEVGAVTGKVEDFKRVSEAWAVWRLELHWRRTAAEVTKRLDRVRQQLAVQSAWSQWKQRVGDRREEEERMLRAQRWQQLHSARNAVSTWNAAVMERRVRRWRADKAVQAARAALPFWRQWTRHRQRLHAAGATHRHGQQLHALQHWRRRLQQLRAEQELATRAQQHRTQRAARSSVQRWRRAAEQHQLQAEQLVVAASQHRRQQLSSAVSALFSHSRQQQRRRQQHKLTRRLLLTAAVQRLRSHALQQRRAWQQHLRARRHRYLHLLSASLRCWRELQRKEEAEAAALVKERCGALRLRWARSAFDEWRRSLQQRREERSRERERDMEAVLAWRSRLLHAAWREWKTALLQQQAEAQLQSIANVWWLQKGRLRAVLDWQQSVQRRQRARREKEAVVIEARRRLLAAATVRSWLQLRSACLLSRHEQILLHRAAQHHQRLQRLHAVRDWRSVVAALQAQRRQQRLAVDCYRSDLLGASWGCWQQLLAMRQRLLSLHLQALQWREERMLQRAWSGWRRLCVQRQQKDEETRLSAVQRLVLEGCQQWLLEQEAAQSRQRVQHWVRRIALHWRRRRAGAVAPLLSREQLRQWEVRTTARKEAAAAAEAQHHQQQRGRERSELASRGANVASLSDAELEMAERKLRLLAALHQQYAHDRREMQQLQHWLATAEGAGAQSRPQQARLLELRSACSQFERNREEWTREVRKAAAAVAIMAAHSASPVQPIQL